MKHVNPTDTVKTWTPSKIKNATTTKLKTLKKPTFQFYAKPTYIDQILVHVDFSSTKDNTVVEHVEPSSGVQTTYRLLVIVAFIFIVLLVYVQFIYTPVPNPEINTHIVSSLIQLGNDPVVSKGLIAILDYTLL